GKGADPLEFRGPALCPDGVFSWGGMFFVALLAFLLASFPARNSDLWMHLAVGRDLVEGPDPFTTAAQGGTNPRVQPPWLYDLLCSALYSAVGGFGLVLFKALLVVVLALVMLRLSQTGPRLGIATACPVLALLTMGPRLLLQPMTF